MNEWGLLAFSFLHDSSLKLKLKVTEVKPKPNLIPLSAVRRPTFRASIHHETRRKLREQENHEHKQQEHLARSN